MGFGTRDSGTQGSGLCELLRCGEGIEPTPGAPSWRQAVVSDDRKQGAGTSGKAEALIRIRDTNDTGGKWHSASVSRLLHRLERLDPASQTVVGADDQR